MKEQDWRNTIRYCHSYGNKVVVAIRNRIRKDDLIDTGALLNSIDYNVIVKRNSFEVQFVIGDGDFKKGSGLPSEYGVYLDQGTRYIDPYYFFTAPIPSLSQEVFEEEITEAMEKDIEIYMNKQIDNELKDI